MSRHRPEVERALAYIAGHLDAPMAVADIAREAHLSEFHLHRVFREAVGETIGRFVTRRRLEAAVLRLAYETDRTITDIALSSGYSSNSNFTKAFTAYFGVSPSRVRQPASELPVAVGLLKARHGKGFHPADLYTLPPERPLDERREIAHAWNKRVHHVGARGRAASAIRPDAPDALGKSPLACRKKFCSGVSNPGDPARGAPYPLRVCTRAALRPAHLAASASLRVSEILTNQHRDCFCSKNAF